MAVMSVLGPVEENQLGVILPHEHLLLDLRNQYQTPSDPDKALVGEEKVSMHRLGILRRNPYALRDNLLLDDINIAVYEMERFRAVGGGSVVDCTSVGIKRDPVGLREIAKRAGVNIIAGCGYYTQDTHPPDMPQRTPEDIAAEIVSDLTQGIAGADICAGVIGEIGTSDPIHPQEAKNLVAAALAHTQTGAPIQIHTYPWGRCGIEAANLLLSNSADPKSVVICHTDVALDVDYIMELLDMGVFVELDNFGKEFYINKADRAFAGGSFATDIERVRAIKHLVDRGYIRQLLLTNDICLKQMLKTYGGWGYDHILTNIVPMMQDEGIGATEIDTLIRDNPRRWLTGGD